MPKNPLDWYWVNPTENNGNVGVYFKNIPPGSEIIGYNLVLIDNGEFSSVEGMVTMLVHITDVYGAVIYQKPIKLALGETPDGYVYWTGGEIFYPKILLSGNGVSLGSGFLPCTIAGANDNNPYILTGQTYGKKNFVLGTALAVIPSA